MWSKPEMNEFAFAANEYVAACGDENKVFKFICDAKEGLLYYWKKKTDIWGLDTLWTRKDGVVDGKPNVRSCVTPLTEGMVIETQHGLGKFGV